ncbi:plastocyanin/azurin family copper-binding protein [Halobacterium sp. R2-5]|uniref:plastocyanin/azurin family copper-binding protein n=1 Tax=Halobacterium sp. R2-5 TaxID=2715751 RepID=UPI0014247783|nr:plastocyanin/azurin family copper-binding protein [Halobacterium sp. R2-5]NIB98771.1 plastocyanin [Halobacterium sp. R2-5]
MDSEVSRRGFLATVAAAAGATAAGEAAAQDETTTIDMTDDLVFAPDSEGVEPGTTVVWENVGSIGHSVTAYEDDIPEDAEFFASGGLESEEAAREAYPEQGDVAGGESYEHTFDVEGTYEYFCIPHESVGMVATLEVTPDAGEQEGYVPALPATAKQLAVWAVTALLGILGFTWAVLKYGGDYGEGGEE